LNLQYQEFQAHLYNEEGKMVSVWDFEWRVLLKVGRAYLELSMLADAVNLGGPDPGHGCPYETRNTAELIPFPCQAIEPLGP
jgi:hypothetical protein